MVEGDGEETEEVCISESVINDGRGSNVCHGGTVF